MANQHPYEVYAPDGHRVLYAPETERYSKKIELDMLDAGYTIRLHGKKITKKEVRA